MHDEPVADPYACDDRVARQWSATGRELNGLAFVALDMNRRGARVRDLVGCGCGGRHHRMLRREPARNDSGHALADPDVGEDFIARFGTARFRETLPHRIVFIGQADAVIRQRLGEHARAEFDGLPVLHVAQIMPDFGSRTARPGEIEPLDAGLPVRGGNDVDRIATRQLGLQRHRIAIDFGGYRLVAHVGVDGVRKINGRGSAGQRHDLALGRKDIDRVWKQVDLDVLDEFTRVPRLTLDIK